MAFELLPEEHADEFHPLSAGNMTFQSNIVIISKPTAANDTFIYAINEVAADAIRISQSDTQVSEILRQAQGKSVTIAGVQPTVLMDSNGKAIHSSSGQVLITANQELIDGRAYPQALPFKSLQGKEGKATQEIWTVQVDLDRRAMTAVSKEPYRLVQSTIQDNLVYAEMNLYMPRAVQVDSGSTVQWVNESRILHNVVGTYLKNATHARVQIDSGFFGEDGRFEYGFDEEGVFEYRCTIHSEEGMKGMIVIT